MGARPCPGSLFQRWLRLFSLFLPLAFLLIFLILLAALFVTGIAIAGLPVLAIPTLFQLFQQPLFFAQQALHVGAQIVVLAQKRRKIAARSVLDILLALTLVHVHFMLRSCVLV